MGIFRRFFTKKNQDVETEASFEESEEEILEVLKKHYVVDEEENVGWLTESKRGEVTILRTPAALDARFACVRAELAFNVGP